MVAVHAVLLGFTASNCIVFGEYVLFALSIQPDGFKQKLLAVALLSGITVMHGCFLKTGILIQNLLGWVKIGLVALMTVTSVFVVIFRPTGASDAPSEATSFHDSWSRLWEGSIWNWGILSLGLFKVFYSYAGLENVTNVLNEVKDPVRTLKSASKTALATSCVLYLLVNVAYFLVVPIEDIKQSGELVAALFFERIFGHRVGRVCLSMAVAVSAAGNVMVVTFALVSSETLVLITQALTNARHALIRRSPGKASCHFQDLYLLRNRSTHLWAACWYTTSHLCSSSCYRRAMCILSFWTSKAILDKLSHSLRLLDSSCFD